MGNSNCNNAVPCLGSESLQDSPKGLTRAAPGKRGVVANKNNRRGDSQSNSSAAVSRSIDTFMMESRETGQSLRSTEHMLSYGMHHQLADETGMPQHYLLDTVGDSSSNADSGGGSGDGQSS